MPQLSTIQREAINSPASGLQVYDITTNSIWYYNGLYWVNTLAMASPGDIKSGIQSNDHSGWILLNGRPFSSLSTNQQAIASLLGLSGNLPDATNAYLTQNGNAIASVLGDNTTVLTQSNLPNVTFNGTAASAGGHAHTATSSSSGDHTHSGSTSSSGNHNHTGTTTTSGNHSHGLPVDFSANNAFWPISPVSVAGFTVPGSASTNSSGNHVHSLNVNSNGAHTHSLTINSNGAHTHSLTVNSSGTHSHSVTVSSGGTATPINIAPKSLSVNMFIYLGL